MSSQSLKSNQKKVIPKDWKRKPIAKICNSIVSGRNKPKKFGGNIPWITPALRR